MIKLSSLTQEVKIRYMSTILFFGAYFLIFLYQPSDTFFGVVEYFNTLMFFAFIPAIFFGLWSMFNRWYFMIPAMGSLFFIIFFTLTPFEFSGYYYITKIDGWGIVIMALVAEILASISFVMYLKRTIKNRKFTTVK